MYGSSSGTLPRFHRRWYRIGDSDLSRHSVVLLAAILLAGTIMAGLAPRAVAQQPEGRTLGGYSFVPSTRVADPFITTHFRNATGLGIASNVVVPIVVVDQPPPAEPDTLLELSGNLVYVLVDFEYQQRFGDRIAVRLAGGGGSRLGTGVEAMLSQGVSVVTSFTAGTTVRVWNSDKFMVSGVFDVGYGSSLRIDLRGWAEQIIEEGIDTNASIATVDDGVILDGGARVAWAPKPYYGFTGLLQIGYTSALQSESRVDGELALAGSIDFAQKGGAPIGLLGSVGYDGINRDGTDSGTTLAFGLGIFYTGKEDFVVGLETSYSNLELDKQDYDINSTAFMLAMRYWF